MKKLKAPWPNDGESERRRFHAENRETAYMIGTCNQHHSRCWGQENAERPRSNE